MLSGRVLNAANYIAGDDVAGACAPASPFTRSLSSLLGLKKGIFLAGTSTRSPVLGLRPTRGLRWRVRKLPKPRISILSPARRERTTLSKIVSTITSLSLRVSSAKRETSSIRSALVIAPLLSWGFVLGLRLNPHNLLKFQGLGASHGFEAQPLWFRGTEVRGLPERRHSVETATSRGS